MAENIKHLCAPIPEALHTKLREQQEKSGKNLSQYMTWLITQFYENETKGAETMDDRNRVHVPAGQFDELKECLQRHNLKQRLSLPGVYSESMGRRTSSIRTIKGTLV